MITKEKISFFVGWLITVSINVYTANMIGGLAGYFCVALVAAYWTALWFYNPQISIIRK